MKEAGFDENNRASAEEGDRHAISAVLLRGAGKVRDIRAIAEVLADDLAQRARPTPVADRQA